MRTRTITPLWNHTSNWIAMTNNWTMVQYYIAFGANEKQQQMRQMQKTSTPIPSFGKDRNSIQSASSSSSTRWLLATAVVDHVIIGSWLVLLLTWRSLPRLTLPSSSLWRQNRPTRNEDVTSLSDGWWSMKMSFFLGNANDRRVIRPTNFLYYNDLSTCPICSPFIVLSHFTTRNLQSLIVHQNWTTEECQWGDLFCSAPNGGVYLL